MTKARGLKSIAAALLRGVLAAIAIALIVLVLEVVLGVLLVEAEAIFS